ncbi:uncharacterized protein BDR25DRAFT_343291 [Lindgomyces ingoldianus]|uniref:Uncharacterized protein n=1 Tax=Lindgomyces ingoldianus TaxID=673940 RepID=A0ACB6QV36_9PLEO|nr:uncharacterized protein BDR25DRAFT_343291 [Lindgomyces ingoldianus]KAF2470061.1 hypothetical protein BDR25DRAFT_343291 [Lindgomyces ingoldianus]
MFQQAPHYLDSSNTPFIQSMRERNTAARGIDQFLANYEQSSMLSASDSDSLDDLGFRLEESPFASTEPSSGASTSDLSSYVFGQNNGTTASSYYAPMPPPNSPHLCPSQLEQFNHLNPYLTSNAAAATLFGQPMSPVCSLTATPQPQCSRANQPFNRRSLSQGSTPLPHNPAFCLLQDPRRRAAAPQDEQHQVRQAPGQLRNHAANKREVRSNPPTSVPIDLHILAMEREEAFIGTPLGLSMSVPGTPMMGTTTPIQIAAYGRGSAQQQQPSFRHMSPEDQARESGRIIEIGAMGVLRSHSRQRETVSENWRDLSRVSGDRSDVVDLGGGLVNEKGARDQKVWILKLVDEVEHHLRQEGGYRISGLEGCDMIREALGKTLNQGGEGVRGGSEMDRVSIKDHKSPSSLITPSEVYTDYNDLYMAPSEDDMFKC